MSEPASISSGIADRYASAIFDLAKDGAGITGLEKDVDTLGAALNNSEDLKSLISSPVYSREEQADAITAIAKKAGLSDTVTNALGLMGQKRRLFVLPQLLKALSDRIAEEKGEVTAEVATAKALSAAQADALAKTLSDKVGKKVKLNTTVDESLIGGLVVKVGSVMIDTSVAAKLNALKNTMKEAR